MPPQLDTTLDIQPLAALRENSAELIEQLKSNRRSIILTVDGKPEAVLQDPAEYQRLLDLVEEADSREGIRRGLEDIAAGRTRPAREVFDELRAKYRIPR
jgi:prevent-host-death family protein